MLKIHGRRTSSNVQAVVWVAGELGLDFERIDIGGHFGGTDTPEYRGMNPMGLIPVLEDGETTLFESAAIVRYLIGRFGPGPFGSAPECDVWAEWGKNTFGAAFTVPIFWAFFRTPEAQRDMPKVVTALRRFEGLASIAMEQRAERSWIVGDKICPADIWVGHVLYRYFTLDLPREVPRGLAAYYDALQERRAYGAHVMVDYSELQGVMRG